MGCVTRSTRGNGWRRSRRPPRGSGRSPHPGASSPRSRGASRVDGGEHPSLHATAESLFCDPLDRAQDPGSLAVGQPRDVRVRRVEPPRLCRIEGKCPRHDLMLELAEAVSRQVEAGAGTSSAYGTPPVPEDGLGARSPRSTSVASWKGSGLPGSPKTFHHDASHPRRRSIETIFGSARSASSQWKTVAATARSNDAAGRAASSKAPTKTSSRESTTPPVAVRGPR